MNPKTWTLALLLALPVVAFAQSQPEGADDTAPVGTQTRSWVDLQVSNSVSRKTAPPMSGEVADKVYQRYQNSFTHPIPEQFSRDSFVSGGSGGGGSQ